MNFTQIKNKVLFLIDQPEMPGYHEIQEAMDIAMESAMVIMERLSELLEKNKEKQLNEKVIFEMQKLDDEYLTTYQGAQHYIHKQKEQSSETSEILSIDLISRNNISDQSETHKKEGTMLHRRKNLLILMEMPAIWYH